MDQMDQMDQGKPELDGLDAPAAASRLDFHLEGPYPAPADDYQPGGDGYRLSVRRDGRDAGYIEMTLIPEERELFVNWVEVPEDLRRQGLGTALCGEALRLWPGWSLGTSGLTDLGAEFWPSLDEGLSGLDR